MRVGFVPYMAFDTGSTMTPRRRLLGTTGGGTLSIGRVMLGIAALLFLMAALGATLGTLSLVPLGLFFLALGLLL